MDGDDYYRAFYEAAREARATSCSPDGNSTPTPRLLRGKRSRRRHASGNAFEVSQRVVRAKPEAPDLHPRVGLSTWSSRSNASGCRSLRFNWTTHERFEFPFDSNHVEKGSHHQKFVVIDGELRVSRRSRPLRSPLGRSQTTRIPKPLRVSRGEPHKPFHDCPGVPRRTRGLLRARRAVCLPLEGRRRRALRASGAVHGAVELTSSARRAAFRHARLASSRTDPHGSPTKTESCREIFDLYLDAIAAAERLDLHRDTILQLA